MYKAAVISGGGSWGADTVGQLLAKKYDYRLVVGTSTGACMAPLVAAGEYDRLCEAYSNMSNDDVFSVKPFKDNMKPRLSSWIYRILSGKLTVGETGALLKTLKHYFREDDFKKLKRRKTRDVVVTYTNLTSPPHLRYKKLSETESYEEFLYFVWASACMPMIASIPSKYGDQLTDGGLTESIPIDYAISNYKCDEVDCFTHEVDDDFHVSYVDSIWKFAGRVIDIMRLENKRSELRIAQLLASESGVKVNYKNMTHKPDLHYAQFDEYAMRQMISTAYDASL